MCLLERLGNENETHIYLEKYNLRMRIKCVDPTQFENKEWGVGNVDSHSLN